MKTKTKIIVIRKSQLAFALVILVIALLLAGLIISAIVTQVRRYSDTESDTSISTHSTAANSDISDLTETTAASATGSTPEATSGSGSSVQTDTAASSTSSGQTDTAAGSTSSGPYTPGVYTSTVILDDAVMEVQVVVDASHMNSISLVNLDETVATSYPLVQPAMENLADQIISSQSVDAVSFSASNQYTSMVLYSAICDALDKARSD